MDAMAIPRRKSGPLMQAQHQASPSSPSTSSTISNPLQAPPMLHILLELDSILLQIVPMLNIEGFHLNYYQSQENLQEVSISSCEKELEDRESNEEIEDEKGLEDLLWPPEVLDAIEKYGFNSQNNRNRQQTHEASNTSLRKGRKGNVG